MIVCMLLAAFALALASCNAGDVQQSEATETEKMQKGTVKEILADTELWGEDLTRFADEVSKYANS